MLDVEAINFIISYLFYEQAEIVHPVLVHWVSLEKFTFVNLVLLALQVFCRLPHRLLNTKLGYVLACVKLDTFVQGLYHLGAFFKVKAGPVHQFKPPFVGPHLILSAVL